MKKRDKKKQAKFEKIKLKRALYEKARKHKFKSTKLRGGATESKKTIDA